jgi:hypothetical protein
VANYFTTIHAKFIYYNAPEGMEMWKKLVNRPTELLNTEFIAFDCSIFGSSTTSPASATQWITRPTSYLKEKDSLKHVGDHLKENPL